MRGNATIAAATIAAAATKPDFSDGNLGPDSADGNLGDEHGADVLGAGCQFWFFFPTSRVVDQCNMP